jgi:hypothetical protein
MRRTIALLAIMSLSVLLPSAADDASWLLYDQFDIYGNPR